MPAERLPPPRTCAREVMRRHVISLAPEDGLLAAAEIMHLGRIREVLVVRAGRLVGQLSFSELCAAVLPLLWGGGDASAREALAGLTVGQVMRPADGWVGPETDLGEVAKTIARRGNGFAPVVEGGDDARLLGLVTERDLLRRAVARPS